jgi:hypothetical protein
MASYFITSHNFVSAHAFGEQITDEELVGLDVPALIEGGHLSPTQPSEPTPVEPVEVTTPEPTPEGDTNNG